MMSIVPPTKRDFTNSNYDKSQFEESAIMLPFGRASFLPAIVDRFQAVPIGMGANTDRQAYTIECLRRRLTLIFSGMGSPAAANALEHANANGVRRLILIGPCGGVDPDVQVGDIIIPTLAIRGEGTSRYYFPGEIPAKPDTELSSNLFDAVEHKQDFGIHRGTIYTTDASYRQGREVYENAEYQIVAVDSECAASFVVASVLQCAWHQFYFAAPMFDFPMRPTEDARAGRMKQFVVLSKPSSTVQSRFSSRQPDLLSPYPLHNHSEESLISANGNSGCRCRAAHDATDWLNSLQHPLGLSTARECVWFVVRLPFEDKGSLHERQGSGPAATGRESR